MPTSHAATSWSRSVVLLAAYVIASAIPRPLAADEPPNTLSQAERWAGWRLLFDGTSADEFRGYRAESLGPGWVVEDGALLRKEKGAGDIVTKETFGEFELQLEYRISPGGNSGVMFHVSEDEQAPWMTGPEVQINDNADGTAAVKAVPAFPDIVWEGWSTETDTGKSPEPLRPLLVTHADDGSGRRFVLEQSGMIHVVPRGGGGVAKLFLDLRASTRQWSTSSNEEGLLGLAFHPRFRENGEFFVCSSPVADKGRPQQISRFRVCRDDPDRADPASEEVVLQFAQPFNNHNGGSIVFGTDGLLYIGLGDGGNQRDPLVHGQNTSTWFSSILRIDIDRRDRGAGDRTVDPVSQYDHRIGKSITGGFVYRGKEIPELAGKYLYGDFISGKLWGVDIDAPGGPVNVVIPWDGRPIFGFGSDEAGEAYVTTSSPTGQGVMRLVRDGDSANKVTATKSR